MTLVTPEHLREISRLTAGNRNIYRNACRDAADEIDRLTALLHDALRGLHNDFEPDNQSALYNRIKGSLVVTHAGPRPGLPTA